MHLVSTSGSERATNDSGKILTCAGRTHVAWQDVTRQGYYNRVRSFDHASQTWSEPVTLDEGIDNHARGVLTIDPEGFVHVILGGHGSAVTWRRTLAPHDTSRWTPAEPVGVGTYPIFLAGPDGTLYLTLRGNGPTRPDRGMDLYRKPPGQGWQPARRVVQLAPEYGQAYAGFHNQLTLAPDGTLHAVIDFYEGEGDNCRGLHQATCYARSRDGGDTWEAADGRTAPVGARPEDLTVLARSTKERHEPLPPPEIKHGGIVALSDGRPVFFWLHHTDGAGRVHLGMIDGDGHRQERIISADWQARWPDMRANGCWCSVRDDDTIFALILLTPYNDEWFDGRLPMRAMNMGERRDLRLVWWISEDGGASGRVELFRDAGQAINCPSLERRVGANRIAADRTPGVFYFDGTNAYPGGGDYYADGQSVADILASGAAPANNVWLAQDLTGGAP